MSGYPTYQELRIFGASWFAESSLLYLRTFSFFYRYLNDSSGTFPVELKNAEHRPSRRTEVSARTAFRRVHLLGGHAESWKDFSLRRLDVDSVQSALGRFRDFLGSQRARLSQFRFEVISSFGPFFLCTLGHSL